MADFAIFVGNMFGSIMLIVILAGLFSEDNGDDRGA